MKYRLIFTLFFSLLFTINSFAQKLNSVVAIVNDSVITQNELNDAMSKAKQQIAASKNPNAIDQTKLKQQVLQQLIDEKLLLALAKRAKITVTDTQVDTAIKNIAQGNHLSVAQMKQALAQQGVNFNDYRAMIQKQLTLHQVEQSAVGAQIHLTPDDLAAAKKVLLQQMGQSQEYHVIDSVSTTKEAAEKIMIAMKKGEKVDTNDMGWQSSNTLPNIFLAQLTHMSPGDVVGPIEAPNGFHVIKLMGVRGPQTALSQEQLKNAAYQMQLQTAVEKWLQTIRKTAYIKIVGE